MDKIAIIVGGHKYTVSTHNAYGPRYLSDLINEVLQTRIIPRKDSLVLTNQDEKGKYHDTNYEVFTGDGKKINPFLISMRDCHLRQELSTVVVNNKVGNNG